MNVKGQQEKKMKNPVWKKVIEIEPGLYWYGGLGDSPYEKGLASVAVRITSTHCDSPRWYAFIGDVPPQPVMPLPDLKDGDPVFVWDFVDRGVRSHFAGWTDDGRIQTWDHGTRWRSKGNKQTWNHYRIPTKEELKQ